MTHAPHDFMEINGLKCQVNLPDAPEGEGVHKLPEYKRIPVYKVDEYPACPSNWMHGSGKSSSYFFPVQPGKHMWLDFNMNANHTNHVAVVMSIQGINPITGRHTKKLQMEQYKEKCPEHEIDFGQDRFCEKCGFKWPAQNYLTTASCPNRHFWIDGWRADEGTIRGFLITAETMKGIATQLIGEDRVWAIGIAFYLSKTAKPKPESVQISTMGFNSHEVYGDMASYESTGGMKGMSAGHTESFCSTGGARSITRDGNRLLRSAKALQQQHSEEVREVETEKLEIGGGAKISQELAHVDPNNLDFYEEEPIGILYGNYCTLQDFEQIIAGGVKDMTAGGEGFMQNLETGNPGT